MYVRFSDVFRGKRKGALETNGLRGKYTNIEFVEIKKIFHDFER